MKDFLLNDGLAKRLYGKVSRLPIIDYHNHLPTCLTAPGYRFGDITAEWISADPYKHRLMRIMGVEERFITGDALPYEKFEAWCSVFPCLVGTPVYDWCLMELAEIFDIDMPICRENARLLWDKTNECLGSMSVEGIMEKFNVEYASPCHNIEENVELYRASKRFAPSLRCDSILNLTFLKDEKTNSFQAAVRYIEDRISYFVKLGCSFVDASLDSGFEYHVCENPDIVFERFAKGDKTAEQSLKSLLIREIGRICKEQELTLLLHSGALRSTSDRLRAIAGPAGGYAGIGTDIRIDSIVRLLNDIEVNAGALPKTVLFSLNPTYNEAFSVLGGSFSREGVRAVVSQGPAWWWCDHKNGITQVLEGVASYGVLEEFVGMTTDSRSIFSFVRHDYFRRILCGFLSEKAQKRELPRDEALLATIAEKICYENAKTLIHRGKRNEQNI